MYATYHLSSAMDITTDMVDSIRATFKSKPITIIVEEETDNIPDWHKKLVHDRLIEINDNPAMLLTEEIFQQKMEQFRK